MQVEDKIKNVKHDDEKSNFLTYSGLNCCQSDILNADWEKDGDIFNRAQYTDRLNNLVKNTKAPYVIALSSAWGTGKTYFLNAWKNKHAYKEGDTDKTPCVYFSAWENEEDDPRIAVVSAIRESLIKSKLLDAVEMTSAAQNLLSCVLSPSVGGRLLLRLGVSGLNKFFDSDVLDTLVNVSGEEAEKILDKYTEKNQNKKLFNEALTSIVEQVKEKTNSPILVMIDELDRCKPDYVISLLESIKHFFSINGLVFVLAIDKNQLLSVVEHTFGLKNEYSQIYLEKFIDLFFELPEADIITYAVKLIKEYFSDIPEEFQDNPEVTSYYNKFRIQLHHAVLLKIISSSIQNISSLRNFEKKIYKFITIYKAYKPCFAYAMLLLKNIMYIDRKASFDEFLCQEMFGKDAIRSDKVWVSKELYINTFGNSKSSTFSKMNLIKNNQVEYRFDNSLPLQDIIYMSLESMLHNHVAFIPQNLSYSRIKVAFIICSKIPQLGVPLSYTDNSSTQLIDKDAIPQIQNELNSMLDFGNLISASDSSNT